MIDISLIFRFIILIVFLTVSAFFSACEAAFFSLTKVRAAALKEKGRRGEIVTSLLEKPRRLLITIYLGNDFINVAISAVVASISLHIFGNKGLSVAIGAGTLLLLIFGDIAPKTFAIKNNERVALFSAYPIKLFSALIYPVQTIFTAIANRAILIFGGKRLEEEPVITEEEIMTMIDVGEEEGAIELEERDMIHSVFGLTDTKVNDLMTPREDIFSIEADTNLKSVISRIRNSFYSRVPVYEGDIDNVIGILYSKDLMKYAYRKHEPLPSLRDILQPPFFVLRTKKVNELLKEFQKKKVHMAIARDEHDKVAGLITMDDVLTELVGEM
jgi:CBS domain containing-hemolysin-like protein